MLKIWGRASSSNVQALMWAVGELGLDYERYDVGHIYGGTDDPDFLAMNPNRTIPVVIDGKSKPMWETGSVLRYLAAQYAEETFWPQNPAERAQIDKWAEWAKLNVAQNFNVPVFWSVVRTAPSKQDKAATLAAIRNLTKWLTIAERQLGKHPFLASDDLTLADIQLGHILYRYYDIDIERPALPNLKAYYRRLSTRPAFIEHVAISYEDLRVTDG